MGQGQCCSLIRETGNHCTVRGNWDPYLRALRKPTPPYVAAEIVDAGVAKDAVAGKDTVSRGFDTGAANWPCFVAFNLALSTCHTVKAAKRLRGDHLGGIGGSKACYQPK